MSKVLIRGAELYRTPKEILQSSDPVFYCAFQIAGGSLFEQGGNQAAVSPGDIVLIDSSSPFKILSPGLSQQISLILPRPVIERALSINKIETGIKISSSTHIARLAQKLLIEASLYENLEAEESAAIIDSLASLIRSSVLKSVSNIDQHAKVLIAVFEFVRENIDRPGLTAPMVANAIGVSVRSLYRAFASSSETLSGYVKAQRLKMCAEYIAEYNGQVSLTEVSYKYGFSSPSYFSTAFKEQYGVTPSKFKKRGLIGKSVVGN